MGLELPGSRTWALDLLAGCLWLYPLYETEMTSACVCVRARARLGTLGFN